MSSDQGSVSAPTWRQFRGRFPSRSEYDKRSSRPVSNLVGSARQPALTRARARGARAPARGEGADEPLAGKVDAWRLTLLANVFREIAASVTGPSRAANEASDGWEPFVYGCSKSAQNCIRLPFDVVGHATAGGVAIMQAREVVGELFDVFQSRGQCVICSRHVSSVDPYTGLGLS